MGQSAKGGHVFVAGEIKLPFTLLVVVPENVEADGVHTKRLAHLDAVFPISTGYARIVELCSTHHKRPAIEQKMTVAGHKSLSGGLIALLGCDLSCTKQHGQSQQ